MRIVMVLAMVAMVAGCTHNLTKVDDGGVYARTGTSNLGSIDAEGDIKAAYNGLGATLLNQDAKGNYGVMPGQAGVVSAQIPNADPNGDPIMAYIISPKDVIIASIKYTPMPLPGQPALEITGLEANVSNQPVAGLDKALTALLGMTRAEAEATVEKWRISGKYAAPVIAKLLEKLAGM